MWTTPMNPMNPTIPMNPTNCWAERSTNRHELMVGTKSREGSGAGAGRDATKPRQVASQRAAETKD